MNRSSAEEMEEKLGKIVGFLRRRKRRQTFFFKFLVDSIFLFSVQKASSTGSRALLKMCRSYQLTPLGLGGFLKKTNHVWEIV